MRENILVGLTSGFTPVIDAGFSEEDYQHIDLSVQNKDLSEKEFNSAEAFEAYLKEFLRKQGKKVAFGGYNEHRGLYRRSDLFSAVEEQDLIRNIHIGIDIWAPVGTAVLAVLEGKIHSFQDNNNFGDYGPTIILEHQAGSNIFYTLYGHLSRRSLEALKVGEPIKQGQEIAQLGEPSENGDYAAHLHFQIINDLNGRSGDFPGVASKRELRNFLSVCPDPNLLLKINTPN